MIYGKWIIVLKKFKRKSSLYENKLKIKIIKIFLQILFAINKKIKFLKIFILVTSQRWSNRTRILTWQKTLVFPWRELIMQK